MGLFLANQTRDGADVQMSVAEWYAVIDRLSRSVATIPLAREIRVMLMDHAHVGPMRVTMTNEQIELVESIVHPA